jgi:hypothetical protein
MPENEKRPNWVERKAARRDNLQNQAQEVWQNVRAAIQDCCESFRKHYNQGLEDKLENGTRIRLTVPYDTALRQTVIVGFNQRANEIEVTVGALASKTYRIDANETHAFVTNQDGKEISADEFTQTALEGALTKPPSQARNTSARPVKEHPF